MQKKGKEKEEIKGIRQCEKAGKQSRKHKKGETSKKIKDNEKRKEYIDVKRGENNREKNTQQKQLTDK